MSISPIKLISIFILSLCIVCLLPISSVSAKNEIVKGALIGGGVGVLSGTVISFVAMQNYRCSNQNRSESCASNATENKIVGLSALGTGFIGVGIGALVGNTIFKNKKINLIPIVDYNEEKGMSGGVFVNAAF